LVVVFFIDFFPNHPLLRSPLHNQPTEDIGIYVVANASSTLAVSGPRAAAVAFGATVATSVVYGVGVKSALAAGVDTSPAIALATAFAAACTPAAAAFGAAQPTLTGALALAKLPVPAAASKALLFSRALPAGIFFAAEYAAFAAAKRHAIASGALPDAVRETPLGRFALGAASITAMCTLFAPVRAMPALAAVFGQSGTTAAQLLVATRSKVAWYGTFEALKTVAHGPHWDAAATPTPAAAAVAAAAAAAEAEEKKEREAAATRAKHAAALAVQQRSSRRLPTRKVRPRGSLVRARGGHSRAVALQTPLRVMTRMVV
jgi:hypothetical protein